MLTWAAPAFLLAGALGALVPLALHLIRRRPPARAPLPTARFLHGDPRSAVRVSRPADPLLLALRMLLLVLTGAALAGPGWLPPREGTADVVLLDRSASMGTSWGRAVALARHTLLPVGGEPRGALVLFDTAVERVPRDRITAALFDSLAAAGTTGARADYAAGLRALPSVARELGGADSVRVRLLSVLHRAAWHDGLAPLRRSAWPGSIDIPELGAGAPPPRAPAEPRPGRAVVVAEREEGGYAAAALAAMGWEVVRSSPSTASVVDARAYLVLAEPSPGAADALVERARRGATLITGPAALGSRLGATTPWSGFTPRADQTGGTIWLGPAVQLAGATGRASGAMREGAAALAWWDDGRPAVAAAPVGNGCGVVIAAAPEGGALSRSASYPLLLDRLARGCEPAAPPADAELPLDQGARAVLRGDGLPPVIAAAAVAGEEAAIELGRGLVLVAIGVALLEAALAYRRRRA